MSSRSPEWELWEINPPHLLEHNTQENLSSYNFSPTPNDEHNASDDSESGNDWYNYYFYSRDRDDEYTLEDLKHLDKETRESIIDYTVEDEFDIAREVEQLLNLQLICHNNNSDSVETSLTSNLLKQFRRIMNLD